MDIRHIAVTTAEFTRLQLARDPRTGYISYSRDAIAKILRDRDITAAVLGDEESVSELLIGWYMAHRTAGGDANPVMEQLISEVMAEDEFGQDSIQRGSHRPQ
jgi:hypothetical protein